MDSLTQLAYVFAFITHPITIVVLFVTGALAAIDWTTARHKVKDLGDSNE